MMAEWEGKMRGLAERAECEGRNNEVSERGWENG